MNETIKWPKRLSPTTTTALAKTAATPHHKPPHHDLMSTPQLQLSLDPHLKCIAETVVDIKKYHAENNNDSRNDPFERILQPHIGMNPFLSGNTYLTDIVVQNTMLRGEGGRG
jgi:hypothetical protein